MPDEGTIVGGTLVTTVEHRRLAEMFPARPNDPIMPNWRRLMLELDLRIGPLQTLSMDWQQAVHQMQQVALVRLNELLGPAYDTLMGFATLGPGWVLARSKTQATMAAGLTVTFVIDEGAERSLFVASQFVVIQNERNRADFAVARVMNYLPASGALPVQILVNYGATGPFEAWLIYSAPSAGISDGGTF